MSREFVHQEHALTVITSSPDQKESWLLENLGGVVLRLKVPRTKDVSNIRRVLSELIMPFVMMIQLKKESMVNERWDGVVWYSPSIFHGPLAKRLIMGSGCRGYLIVRDIFPEWTVDIGLLGHGLTYYFFKAVACYQYSVANVIGIQTSGNKKYFVKWSKGLIES